MSVAQRVHRRCVLPPRAQLGHSVWVRAQGGLAQRHQARRSLTLSPGITPLNSRPGGVIFVVHWYLHPLPAPMLGDMPSTRATSTRAEGTDAREAEQRGRDASDEEFIGAYAAERSRWTELAERLK